MSPRTAWLICNIPIFAILGWVAWSLFTVFRTMYRGHKNTKKLNELIEQAEKNGHTREDLERLLDFIRTRQPI